MKQKQLAAIFILTLSFFSIHLTVTAQTMKYREHQVIKIPGGQKVEILSCRGEGENEECEVIYYSSERQTGKRVWESANTIRASEKKFRDSVIASYYQPPIFETNKNDFKKASKPGSVNKKTSAILAAATNPLKTAATKLDIEKDKVWKSKTDSSSSKKVTTEKKVIENTDTIQLRPKEVLEKNNSNVDSTGNNSSVDTTSNKSVVAADPEPIKKLSVFIDCNTGCDMNYMRTEFTIVDFLLDMTAADVHVMINEQRTGGGGSAIQIIFYGQNHYKRLPDTLIVNVPPNSTEFERRAEMLKGIKRGLIPFLLKTGYAKYIDVNIKLPQTKREEAKSTTKDPWNYWVVRIGADGSFDRDQVYKSTSVSGNLSVNRTTEKLKVNFRAKGNYYNYKYSYDDNGNTTVYEVLNRELIAEHSLITSLGSHWGIGYQTAYSKNTFSNNKSRIYAKAAVEYSIFPYKDVNTRFFTISYGLDVRTNKYYDTTIYFKTEEVLIGHIAQASIAFNQKWGTFSSSATYRNFFKDPTLSNLSAKLNWDIRITGGLSFYVYTYGAYVRDQVYLPKGKARVQDVLTRQRELASEYTFSSGIGLNFRFGSKLNNFVNATLMGL